MIKTPVLIIGFNRPELLQKVVDALSVHRLAKLYLFVDGPREGNDDDRVKIAMCKKIFDKIDFCDEIIKIYSEKNLGCGGGPFYAISKMFESEEMGIILEDDCVPAKSFPGFCEELLVHYANESKVSIISGNNFSEKFDQKMSSHYFSIFPHFWGWATWKRFWVNVELPVEIYISKIETVLLNRFPKEEERNFFFKEFTYNLNHPAYDGWDYQAALTIFENDGLCVVPKKNLVSNIGSQGTHFNEDRPFFNLAFDDNFTVASYPTKIERDLEYDSFHFRNHWLKVNKLPFIRRLIRYLRKRINSLIDYWMF
jgi:hypothetical protein